MLTGGFNDQPRQSSRAFRAAMEAMARPGTIHTADGAAPPALSVAAGVLLLTLADRTTGIWLAPALQDAQDWITFHTGAPFVPPEDARIAIGAWTDLPLARFPIGRPDYPDRSATLIVEMPALSASGLRIEGPGIQDHAHLSLPEVDAFRINASAFPLGLDFFFTCGDRLAALPRTTKVEAA